MTDPPLFHRELEGLEVAIGALGMMLAEAALDEIVLCLDRGTFGANPRVALIVRSRGRERQYARSGTAQWEYLGETFL